MQDSNTTTTHIGGGARQEPVMDRTTTMQVSAVSRSAHATRSFSFSFFPFFHPPSTPMHSPVLCKHLHSEDSR
jgi:hypothetical protein